MYDLLIRNGTIVDGLGTPRYKGTVAVKDGRLAAVGFVQSDDAERVIDATDLVVAPGFVDPHTHYDAQIAWDRMVSVSSWHGVTTVVIGNCGVGLAPYRPQDRETGIWDLVNVEGIPYEILSQIDWQWESFPD